MDFKNSDSKKKAKKTIGDAYIHQISVLKCMSSEGIAQTANKMLEVEEIAVRSGVKDEKEVLRYLYILEGQKLVSPQPPGDFTSKTWSITQDGVRALKTIESAAVA